VIGCQEMLVCMRIPCCDDDRWIATPNGAFIRVRCDSIHRINCRASASGVDTGFSKEKNLGCPCGDIGDNPKNSESIRIPEMIPYVVMNSSCSKFSVTHNETIYSVVFHFTPLFSIPFSLLTCRKVLILLQSVIQ
jgi:hypothetical protein